MKALAARRYADREDLAVLIRVLGLTTVEQVESVCIRVFPHEPLSGRARLLVEEVLDEVSARGSGDAGRDGADET